MMTFGSLFRQIDHPDFRLELMCSQIEVKPRIDAQKLQRLGSSEHAEVYNIVSEHTGR